MIFVGIVFIFLIILVICVIDNESDRYGLAIILLITGMMCVIATYITLIIGVSCLILLLFFIATDRNKKLYDWLSRKFFF